MEHNIPPEYIRWYIYSCGGEPNIKMKYSYEASMKAPSFFNLPPYPNGLIMNYDGRGFLVIL